MGCFSIPCAVSGIPIYSEPCVYIPVAKCRDGCCEMLPTYLPVGFPVFGNADNYGGIDTLPEPEKKQFVLILREVWDNWKMFQYWDCSDQMIIDPKEFKECVKHHKKIGMWEKGAPRADNLSIILNVFYLPKRGAHGKILRDIFFESTPIVVSKKYPLIIRGEFQELIVQKLLQNKYTKELDDQLKIINTFWRGVPFLTGKDIVPTDQSFFCEQNMNSELKNRRMQIYSTYCKILEKMAGWDESGDE